MKSAKTAKRHTSAPKSAKPAAAAAAGPVVVVMHRDKECRNVDRFNAGENLPADAAIPSYCHIYVAHTAFAGKRPTRIRVTVEALD